MITSRVHPGESNASFAVQGTIEYLLSEEAQELRDKFVFKIMPMLNPDGVIYGNYRSSSLGVDLNRRWKNPSKFLHPSIYYSKALITWLSPNVALTCDFHGHSRKKNIFMYGCCSQTQDNHVNAVIHSVPEAVNQSCDRFFSMKDCKFTLEKEKETTARIVIFKELGILNSYTLECTFFCCDKIKQQIAETDLIEVGRDFCKGIWLASLSRHMVKHWFPQRDTTDAWVRKSSLVEKRQASITKN